MTEEELFSGLCQYACDVLSFEERRSMPLDVWKKFVKENFEPIPKTELEIGKDYKGICRNSNSATWDGKRFTYLRYKFGSYYEDHINHYEDDDGYDLFIPIKSKI